MRSRIIASAGVGLALVLLASVAVASAATTKTRPFNASFAGRAVVRATSDTSADINITGAGKGNVTGAAKVAGVGAGFQGEPCATFSGKGTITAKTGKIAFTITPGAKACPTAANPDVNAITGAVKVVSGTGAFKGAKGALRIGGTYDKGTGKFVATFKGPLTTAK